MELTKEKVNRNECEYTDLYLTWEYEGKCYKVRVRPVFARDYDKLIATAKDIAKQRVPRDFLFYCLNTCRLLREALSR